MNYYDFQLVVTVKGETRAAARLSLEAFLDEQHDKPSGVLSDSYIEKDRGEDT